MMTLMKEKGTVTKTAMVTVVAMVTAVTKTAKMTRKQRQIFKLYLILRLRQLPAAGPGGDGVWEKYNVNPHTADAASDIFKVALPSEFLRMWIIQTASKKQVR